MRGMFFTIFALASATPSLAQTGAQEAVSAAEDDHGSGMASYYGSELAGNRTASGERFNPEEMTAAHPSLPFGSRVRVTHVASGRSTIVRINDRGPFRGKRIIDISRAAARAIGLDRLGTGLVRLARLRD